MSRPSKQKALALTKPLGEYEIIEVVTYTPKPGEVLIKIKATGINPVDWKLQKYGFGVPSDQYPIVMGEDLAGVVEEVGEGVTEFKKGDRVFGQSQFLDMKTSGFQQYAIALAATTGRIPDGISFEQAATLATCLSCAASGLYSAPPNGPGYTAPLTKETEGKYAGEPLVVIGGASSLGQLVIQLAKQSGFSPIITTASERQTDWLKSLGATHVISRALPDDAVASFVSNLTVGKHLNVVYDAISAPTTQALGLKLTPKGGILIITFLSSIKPEEAATAGVSVIYTQAHLRSDPNREILEKIYHDLACSWLENGILKPNNVEIVPNGFSGVAEALRKLQSNQVSGFKFVVRPEDTMLV